MVTFYWQHIENSDLIEKDATVMQICKEHARPKNTKFYCAEHWKTDHFSVQHEHLESFTVANGIKREDVLNQVWDLGWESSGKIVLFLLTYKVYIVYISYISHLLFGKSKNMFCQWSKFLQWIAFWDFQTLSVL